MFNNGKPYHGSDAVKDGKLQGATDGTDYFYLFCPQCPDKRILRILDYSVHQLEPQNPYNAIFRRKAKKGFALVFRVRCEQCGHEDFVKISNMGWQGGTYADALSRSGQPGQSEAVENAPRTGGTEGVRYIFRSDLSASKAITLSLAGSIVVGIWASGKAKRRLAVGFSWFSHRATKPQSPETFLHSSSSCLGAFV